ncbi:MAG: LytTR family DNA-binding domain-containing protein [Acidobacteriota bacterium]
MSTDLNVPIRTVLVDDEPLALDKLRGFLESSAQDVVIVATASDGASAVEVIEAHQPDLIFLDIQMPEIDGFEVLRQLVSPRPAVVFVTAFDQYALKAFEVHAIDYLLKPYDRERFEDALKQARAAVGQRRADALQHRLTALLDDLTQQRRAADAPERLAVKTSGKVVFVDVDDIDWIDAAGNYVRLHVGGEHHLMRDTMAHLEARLDPRRFLRIHRSTIVNIQRIRELQQQFHGDYLVVLDNGQRLTLSRSYRDRVQELIAPAG